MTTRTVVFSLLLALAGCGSVADTGLVEEEAQGGCSSVCPKCKHGEVCPMIACYLDCHGQSQHCGGTVCKGGQKCCNESCGICAGPNEMCSDRFCPAPPQPHVCLQTVLCLNGDHWSDTECACVADKPTHGPSKCQTNADCRLFSDYCSGCDCRALSTHEPDPKCPGPDSASAVRCMADPCGSSTAVCVNGTCSVQ
jgi:hypothetical protein